ncbi:MAG: hypothetical protein II970_05925 [Paludibacteraceae bacterium]|nr:hypothetical protein [Paludibacteraceae bacterium]
MKAERLQDVWNGLLAYNLTTDNKRWLAEQLWNDAESEDMAKPYTRAELAEIAEAGRRQIAEGLSYTTEEVLRMCSNGQTV